MEKIPISRKTSFIVAVKSVSAVFFAWLKGTARRFILNMVETPIL